MFTVHVSNSDTLLLGSYFGDGWRQSPKHCSPPTRARALTTQLLFEQCCWIYSLANTACWSYPSNNTQEKPASVLTANQAFVWKDFMLMALVHSHTVDPHMLRSGCGQPAIKPAYSTFMLMDSKQWSHCAANARCHHESKGIASIETLCKLWYSAKQILASASWCPTF